MTTPGSPCPSPPTTASPARSCWTPSAPPCRPRPARLDPDRQRHGLHHETVRGQGRPQRLRARAAPPWHTTEERQAEPPPDPGQGRAVPADTQEMAHRPAPPACRPRPAPGTARRVHRHYNPQRPHKSLPARATPATAYAARPKAAPGDRAADTHDRVRTDRIWTVGTVTLRHAGKLHHIGVGRKHAGTEVLSSPRTCTSGSSPRQPASSSASSPSTPAATTSPPARPRRPRQDETPRP